MAKAAFKIKKAFFHQQTGIKFKYETSKMSHLEQSSFVALELFER